MNFALGSPECGSRVAESRVWSPTLRKVFKSWSSNASFMRSSRFWVSLIFFFEHGSQVNLAFQSLNADFIWASRWASTLCWFQAFFLYTNCCVFPFAVWYSSNPLYKKYHFEYISGFDQNIIFILQRTASVITGKLRERWSRVSMPICLLSGKSFQTVGLNQILVHY